YIQSGKYEGMMLMGPDGILSESIRTTDNIRKTGYLGNMNPDAILGFNTNVKYKNFRLNVVTSLRLGGIFVSETQKILIDDGMADMKAIYGNEYHDYWVGGRFEGGLPNMPRPEEMFQDEGFGTYRELMQNVMSLYNGDPRYFGYSKGVFIDPNYDVSSLSPEEKLELPDEAYIVNGEDPTKTIYLIPYGMEGNLLWYGSQFRTHDATSFKVKEINLTYSFDRSIAQRLSAQNIHITAFAKNPMFWAKNSMNEDPETAFRDGLTGFGVPEFTLPPIRSMGVKLAIDF